MSLSDCIALGGAVISIVAIGVSIWAIIAAKMTEESRRLKDSIMDTFSQFHADMRDYLLSILEQKKPFETQQFISDMKFKSMQLTAITEYTKESVNGEIAELAQILSCFENIRQIVTDSQEFVVSHSQKNSCVLSDRTILEVEQEFTQLYKSTLLTMRVINSKKCK